VTDRRILLDTGPLVSLLVAADHLHQLCTNALATIQPPLLTCWPVLTEAAWLLRKQNRPMDRLAQAQAGGMFEILPLTAEDLPAIAAIMRRYEDIGLQFADAVLAHLAEREDIRTVFTNDRRDFSIIRLKRNRSLKLIPDVR
jgi:predicted nucleic acid-binding protein